VASSDRIRADLGWTPEHTDLAGIVRDAWHVSHSKDPSAPHRAQAHGGPPQMGH
jgi:UDP-glucose 4-epimerase